MSTPANNNNKQPTRNISATGSTAGTKPTASIQVKTEPKLNETAPITNTTANASAGGNTTTAAAPKRTFVPNLAIKREKKDSEPEKLQEQANNTNQKDNRRQFQPNVGRGRGGRQQNLIQSTSIFAAGPAELAKKFASKDSLSNSSGSIDRVIGGIGASIGSGSVGKLTSESKSSDNKRIKGESLDIDEILLDEKLQDESGPFVKLESIKESKTQITLKKSKSLEDINKLQSIFLNTNNDNQDDLYLFQMVDCLRLLEMPEGKLGKLKIYKSGRIELCMGNNIKLDVSLAAETKLLQDIVNVQVDETTETGSMTCMGHIKNKILCTPKFEDD